MKCPSFIFGAPPLVCMLFCGCLYTTHQFNTGRTVPAGVSTFTMGFGTHAIIQEECPEYIIRNGTRYYHEYYSYNESYPDNKCRYSIEHSRMSGDAASEPHTFVTDPSLEKIHIPKISLGYRLGVRDSWGPLTGVDIGIHFEAPTLPATALFDMRLGLPPLPFKNIHHALGIGFIMGAWADNGYFAGYAISKIFGKTETYAHCRAIYHNTLITQMEEMDIQDDFKIPHKRRWVGQFSAGAKWTLPDIPVIPDFLIPQINATYPMVYANFDQFGDNLYRNKPEFKFNMGMGWNF